MKKIKISTIVLIVCFLITFIFDSSIPMFLGISIGVLNIIMLVLLNVEMFKVKGLIRRLILYIDAIVGLFIILTFIPNKMMSYSINNFLSHPLVFVFAILLISILVNAYMIDKKD